MIFSFTYYLLAVNDPDQIVDLHTRLDAIYFSASTVATVGFGDIHASGPAGPRPGDLADRLQPGASSRALVNLLRDQIAIVAAPPREARRA